jgi:CheY-like chemotaxis protein
MAKIVVVEDDPDIIVIIQHTLRMAGHTVILALGGEDGIRKVKAHRPDLVITDLRMPGVNGVEVISAVRDDPDTSNTPIIAVTAHVWDRMAQTAGAWGCDGFISKPFERKKLLAEVEKQLRPLPKP